MLYISLFRNTNTHVYINTNIHVTSNRSELLRVIACNRVAFLEFTIGLIASGCIVDEVLHNEGYLYVIVGA